MARLIDADVLPIAKEYCVDEAGFGCNFYVVHKTDIDKAPTIDAKPVVHGEWEYCDTVCTGDGMAAVYYCTECRFCIDEDVFDQLYSTNHCPNCGADMRERKET